MASKVLRKKDVVIVGVGASGGLAAMPLARAGLEVVGLEVGPRLGIRDFPSDEVRNDLRNWFGRARVNNDIPTVRANANGSAVTATTPSANIGRGLTMNAVGGTTIHWTGQSWRLHEWDFKKRSEVVRRYGAGAIPPNSTMADWPLTYQDLEPYYDKVEYLHGVSGKAGNINGQIDERGNVFEGPRSREYPLPPLRRTGFSELMLDAAKRLNWHPYPGPAGIRSQIYRGMAACEYHGFCTWTGCHVNAKAGSHLAGIPQAEATGNFEVVPNARVTKIAVNRDGRVSGVLYVKGGRWYFQPADVVLLSSYTYENSRILLHSKSRAYPNGLSNNHGQVGKHFTTHSFFGVSGLFPGRQLNRHYGTGSQWTAVDDFEGGAMDASGLGFVSHSGLFSGGGEQKPIGVARNTPPNVPRWGPAWKDWLAKNANAVGGASVQLDIGTYDHNFLDLDPARKDPMGIPVVRVTYDFTDNERRAFAFYRQKMVDWLMEAGASETWAGAAPPPLAVSTHAFGGTRMGTDPETSVVDAYGFSHEAPNLGVLGGSTFVSAAGRNPTETIWALAWRTADHLVENWGTIAG
jgi:gluconate 2-dehydrogenase alpha chain